jgi:hypothetical protein
MPNIINAINETVLVLGVAVCLPRTLTELIRACVPVVTAITELRDQISTARSHDSKVTGLTDEPGTRDESQANPQRRRESNQ